VFQKGADWMIFEEKFFILRASKHVVRLVNNTLKKIMTLRMDEKNNVFSRYLWKGALGSKWASSAVAVEGIE
jgi:hypothetical protein